MTGQIPDLFKINGTFFERLFVKGGNLYKPQSFGIAPFMSTTACQRGYLMIYECIEDKLSLSTMLVNSKELKKINGIEPDAINREKMTQKSLETNNKIDTYYSMFNSVYENLNLKTDFTGIIFAGREVLPGGYTHMGLPNVIEYKYIRELMVRSGKIVKNTEISNVIKGFRKNLGKKPFKKRFSEKTEQKIQKAKEEIENWIEKRYKTNF